MPDVQVMEEIASREWGLLLLDEVMWCLPRCSARCAPLLSDARDAIWVCSVCTSTGQVAELHAKGGRICVAHATWVLVICAML